MRKLMVRTSFLVEPKSLEAFKLGCAGAGKSMANVLRDFIEAIGRGEIIIERGCLTISVRKRKDYNIADVK